MNFSFITRMYQVCNEVVLNSNDNQKLHKSSLILVCLNGDHNSAWNRRFRIA